MVAYGIVILLLIKNMKEEYPDGTQLWYADYSGNGTLCTFKRVKAYFNLLQKHGTGQVYCTKPSKIILILHLENPQSINMFGLCHGFKMFIGARYPGCYIGDDDSKCDWLENFTETWEWSICMISETAVKYPRESYAMVVCVIQSDCIFLQHVTKNTRYAFAGVEKVIWETFLLHLFFG